MARTVLSVIVGYLVMVVLVFALYSAALRVLGPEGSYRPGSWEPSAGWIALSFVAGLVAAYAGGAACLRLARQTGALKGLIGLIVVLGIVTIVAQAGAKPPDEPRPANLSPMEAAAKSVTPLWVGVGHVVVGIAGVWLSGRRRRA